jgi:hypothetical protein
MKFPAELSSFRPSFITSGVSLSRGGRLREWGRQTRNSRLEIRVRMSNCVSTSLYTTVCSGVRACFVLFAPLSFEPLDLWSNGCCAPPMTCYVDLCVGACLSVGSWIQPNWIDPTPPVPSADPCFHFGVGPGLCLYADFIFALFFYYIDAAFW